MFLIMTITNNMPNDLILLTKDIKSAESKLIDVCEEKTQNKLTQYEKNIILYTHYLELTHDTIVCVDLSRIERDDSICSSVTHCPDYGCGGLLIDDQCDFCGKDWKEKIK